ncbi:MAG: type II toxin-antitoxin system HicB family antitoxin [Bacteroidaceae bacterium]|nr:type II toxin-antitoxin system HicB family antitoxin [Bacteroidaceae bacterium]
MGKEQLITASLSAYVFAEDGNFVAYCPELDMSAAGTDEEDARTSLSEVLSIYFNDTISRGTLEEDLLAHGWRKRGSSVAEPTTSTMLRRPALRSIMGKREFHKYPMPLDV